MVGLEHLSEAERQDREKRLEACIQQGALGKPLTVESRHLQRLWNEICETTSDWSERLALVDAHLCVTVSLGEMMISKGVFGQKHVEGAASLLSEFLVLDHTEIPEQRASRARLIKDRMADISLGAGERRALRLLETRIDLELKLLEGSL